MKRIIITLFISLAIIAHGNDISAKYRKAPNFALFNLKGKLVTLSNLSKKGNIILSFWASYCKPCIKEMPQLVELEKKYGVKKNLRLILVNIDKEGKTKALPILQQLNIENMCLMDIYQLTAKKYAPDLKVPVLFLINRKGSIIFEAIGEKRDTIEKLERAIKMLR